MNDTCTHAHTTYGPHVAQSAGDLVNGNGARLWIRAMSTMTWEYDLDRVMDMLLGLEVKAPRAVAKLG